MAIHHYVVTYNTETNEWLLDDDTLMARFSDGTIYDQDNEEWGSESVGNAVTDETNATVYNAIEELNNGPITTGKDNPDDHCEHCIWDGVAYWVDGEPIAQWIACDACNWGNE